jgi:hypothetical protein
MFNGNKICMVNRQMHPHVNCSTIYNGQDI